MINQRGALCDGRSTIVVVVIFLGIFITFDSYTYHPFSTLSKAVSPDYFTSSSKDRVDSTVSSWATETGHKSITDVGLHGEGIDIDSQKTLEAEGEAQDQVDEFSHDSEFRGRKSEASTLTNGTVERNGDARTRPQAENNQTRIFTTISESYDANDSGSSNEGDPPGNDRTRENFNESESQNSKDPGSLKEKAPRENDQKKNYINGSESHTVRDTGSVIDADSTSASTTAAKTRVPQLTGIQRVELDLWQARTALKRVALIEVGKNDRGEGSHPHTTDEPQGEAYKNAALFRQSYHEMENRLKIYIYQDGEEPLVHDGPCKEIYAVEGRFIQQLQDNNPFVTSDPEEAHVFFLPFSVAMMVTYLYKQNSGDMSPLLRFVQDYVHVIAGKYPFWNRSEGADHFMLSCHDWGPYVSRVDHNLFTKSIRVLCNANTSEGFVPYKDSSLPEINLVGGEVATTLGGLRASARPYLAFFAGADHGPVRPKLFMHWEGKDSDILVYKRIPVAGFTYHDYMKSSKFCLCPGGYEVNSPRVVEAIYNDCIPVIIADHFVLPFSDVLDWSKFSVQVSEQDISNLKAILEAVPLETLLRMQNRVKQARKHFLLNQPPEKYDAFHMILHSVWLRRLNIRLLG